MSVAKMLGRTMMDPYLVAFSYFCWNFLFLFFNLILIAKLKFKVASSLSVKSISTSRYPTCIASQAVTASSTRVKNRTPIR